MIEMVAEPTEEDHKFEWVEYNELRGNMYLEMQNWALDKFFEVYISDNGDGTFTNPVLYCDYSDPDAIRVGEDYYLVASSFTNTPGLPILHSKDLVNWNLINYCVKNVPEDVSSFRKPRHGEGVWAPSIRYHDGLFYVCFPMPDEGIYMTTASDPYGVWSEPVNIRPGAGWIDPCPFWDDDGKVYLVSGVAKSRIGYNSVLYVTELASDAMSVKGEPVKVFDGNQTGDRTTEGPKLYKRNGYYYIFAPAGGVKPGYQLVLRSRNIYGPYEKRIVLKQGSSDINGPHQGAWVDTPKGDNWFLHFQDVYAAGRIVHLQPMTFEDDWPVIGKKIEGECCGEPVRTYKKPLEVASYNEKETTNPGITDLYLRGWQWNANHEDSWITNENDDESITLYCNYDEKERYIPELPCILLKKWEAPEFEHTYKLDLSQLCKGDYVGVINLGMSYLAVVFEKKEDKIVASSISGRQEFTDGGILYNESETEICSDVPHHVYIKYEVKNIGMRKEKEIPVAPEEIVRYYMSYDGKDYNKVAEISAEAGRWVGVKQGVFALSHNEASNGRLIVAL
ncbi:glycoside hydrolase family 43 protein [Butyrivibrio sp. YAB3001]|uniref:glycoside hydrolase family 43 protein n=1 Tax=Butyrivibrio sp. YAB3001 TaxID=1520812 RepID=UPI001FA8FE7A|nr:glycoside hydrolase 43 family protein [Butyrivibrio sp. YAB3001]